MKKNPRITIIKLLPFESIFIIFRQNSGDNYVTLNEWVYKIMFLKVIIYSQNESHFLEFKQVKIMKFIDLSIPIINPDEFLFDPPFTQPHIEYGNHERGADEMGFVFPKLNPKEHLDKVPPIGATIYCFPVKIARASAGWVRAVATIPD